MSICTVPVTVAVPIQVPVLAVLAVSVTGFCKHKNRRCTFRFVFFTQFPVSVGNKLAQGSTRVRVPTKADAFCRSFFQISLTSLNIA